MVKTVLYFVIFGLAFSLSSQSTIEAEEAGQNKCYIEEIIDLQPRDCCDNVDDEEKCGVIEGNTVRHGGVCTIYLDESATCINGHWSGTDTSIALNRKKRWFFFFFIPICYFFCRRGRRGGGGGRETIKYPPTFPEPCKPHNVQNNYDLGAGEDSVVVSWTKPTATDRDGGNPRETQVGGGTNGGRFDGATYGKTHYITYKATDDDGLTGHCHFSFTVTELTCGSLPWPSNGARTCENNNILGSTCHYTCNTGYQLIGSSTVTCENKASPSWTAIPTCEKQTCGEPVFPDHTTSQCSDPSYGYQSVCSMACDSGFRLTGPYYLQCKADGTWLNVGQSSCVDDTPPTITCVTPQTFYADRLSTSTTVTWQVPTATDVTDANPSIIQTYGPDNGAVLEVGTEFVKYKAVDVDGSESQECFIELNIEELTCGHPLDSFADEDYMRFSCSTSEIGYVYGTSCTLSCTAHLPLEGTDTITCEDNGQSEGAWSWGSGDKPYCRHIACPEVDAPTNGALVHDTVLTRPIRTIMCNAEYDIPDMGTNFNGQLLCTDDGSWIPFTTVPECIVPKNPRFIRLPSEIFYYGGSCGDAATLEQIKANFQSLLDTDIIPYLETVCDPGETCTAENIVITCGPVDDISRKKRSLSWEFTSPHLRSSRHVRSLDNEDSPVIHKIEKRNTETHLLVLEFYIVNPLNFTDRTFTDALQFYDNLQINTLKPAIQELVNNGTFDLDNFLLRDDSFATPSYGDITCDPNYMLDQTTCKPCPVGYFINETTSKCDQCPDGMYKDDESSSTCSTCPSGYTSLVPGSTSQSDCVKQCSPGTISPNTVETCSVCPVGYYQDEYGQTTCKQCPTGTTTAFTNSTAASDCKTFDTCTSSPCNGHVCNNVHGIDVCTCQDGWSGTNCTIPPDLCSGNACENGATCVSGSTNYTCSCANGQSGQYCEISSVNGGWSEWSTSACSKTCGTGSLTRSRTCDSPAPDTNGADCVGDATETVACNTETCPECEALTSETGTLFNCTTNEATGSETCTVYCEDGKVLPPGLTEEEQSYTCGLSTNYEWDYMENIPTCVDPVSPGNLNISVSLDYNTNIPASAVEEFKTVINNQLSGLKCFDSADCQAVITIDGPTLKIDFTIPTAEGADLEYGNYISSGSANAELQEVIDAINNLEETAQYIQNNTNELFDVNVDGVSYTVADDSLTIDGVVSCGSGFVAYDGICVACPAGTHSVDDVCTFCEKGKYQPDTGQTTCISCPDVQTTNAVGSTGIAQCTDLNSTTSPTDSKPDPMTPRPHDGDGEDDENNGVTVAVLVSVLALIVAIAAVALVYYKKFRTNSAVNCSHEDIRVNSVRTRFNRKFIRTPAAPSRGPTSLSEYQNGSDVIQSPRPPSVQSSTSYLTADDVSLRCGSPPPPYEENYAVKHLSGDSSTYAVINDTIPPKKY